MPTLQARTLSYLEKAEEKKRGKKEGEEGEGVGEGGWGTRGKARER